MKSRNILTAAAISMAALTLGPNAHAQMAGKLFFEGDTVRGHPQEGATGATCVLNSQFKHKEEIVWRVRVLDPKTGEQVGKEGLKSLVVHLSSGEHVDMHFGTHPRKTPTDSFWAGSWQIPHDYPNGSFTYKVVATDLGGKQHEWTPFNVGLSRLTVIPGEATFTK